MSVGSLRLRLLLGAMAFVLAAMVLATMGLSLLFERHVKTWIDTELNAHIDQIIAGIDRDAGGEITVATPPADPRFVPPRSGRYWQATFEGSGKVVRSRSLWDFEIRLPDAMAIDAHAHHHSVPGPGNETLYVLQKRIELPARLGRETVRVAAAVTEKDVHAAVVAFATSLAPFLLLLGALLAAAAWIQVSLGLRPLARLRDRIAAIRSGEAKRLGEDFPEEVQPLTREIDTLLDARDRQITTARARASDLAHGLKTPLQVLIGGVTKLKAKGETEIAGDLEAAASGMQRHVDRHLAKARLQANSGTFATAVLPVAERVAGVVRKTPAGLRLDWSLDGSPTLAALIHPDDLAESLGGLIENAARHARSRVAITARAENDHVAIRVSDDGPGIPEEHQADVLARGRRLDSTTPGSGLGLAIVADIAEAWDGSIAFERGDQLFSAILRLKLAGQR